MRDQPDIYGANGGASPRDSGIEVGGRSQVTARAAQQQRQLEFYGKIIENDFLHFSLSVIPCFFSHRDEVV